MSFKDRIAKYNAQKDTKVNPPEAKTVLEEKSAPEVANSGTAVPPAEYAAAPEPSQPNGATPVASPGTATVSASPGTTEDGSQTEAPKAKRGRPAGSKNSPKPPATEPASEATSAVEVRNIAAADLARIPVEVLCQALAYRGFVVTLRTATPGELGE